jgi:integrase
MTQDVISVSGTKQAQPDNNRKAHKRTGTIVKTRDGCWQPVIRLADGTKKRFPRLAKGTSEARARDIAAHYQEDVDRRDLVRPNSESSRRVQMAADCEEWVKRWHASRAKLPSARLSAGHWNAHLRSVLGAKHPTAWTRDDFRHVSKCLDDKVAAKKISWKTAKNIWGTATKMAFDAVESKDDAIRCRDDNPASNVRGPDAGDKVDLQYLFPSEFSQVMASTAVPIEWRRAIAIAVYLYARVGELRALTWDDVHLDQAFVHVTKSIDAVTGKVKTTKTKCPRKVPIEPHLVPLLRAMKQESGGTGPVLRHTSMLQQADGFRSQLRASGVQRAALFHKGPSVRPIRFHDLRATGITWRAVRGDTLLEIKRHAGHQRTETTERYIREADDLRGNFGAPFSPLPASLISPIGSRFGSHFQKVPKTRRFFVGHEGLEPSASGLRVRCSTN